MKFLNLTNGEDQTSLLHDYPVLDNNGKPEFAGV
jgi:hypothetical protein